MIADGVLSHSHRLCLDPVTLGVGALLLTAGSTGASIYQSNRQADRAEDAREDQANEQKRLRAELEEKQRQEEASTAARDARNRQRLAGSRLGRRSTQFTGPLGLPELGFYNNAPSLGGGR